MVTGGATEKEDQVGFRSVGLIGTQAPLPKVVCGDDHDNKDYSNYGDEALKDLMIWTLVMTYGDGYKEKQNAPLSTKIFILCLVSNNDLTKCFHFYISHILRRMFVCYFIYLIVIE